MKPCDRFDSLIQYWGEKNRVPFPLLKAQMMAESSGDPMAVSSCGARGLFQFMPGTAKEQGINDPHNPDEAARAASQYMAKLYTSVRMAVGEARVSDPNDLWRLALASYNCGFGYVRVALRRCLEDQGALGWDGFVERLPAARYNGRYPRAATVVKYVERILPSGAEAFA